MKKKSEIIAVILMLSTVVLTIMLNSTVITIKQLENNNIINVDRIMTLEMDNSNQFDYIMELETNNSILNSCCGSKYDK
tara:strand:- start:234 stop:470 length:237 start_codon:yes stop_codon:yes gene_type:complete